MPRCGSSTAYLPPVRSNERYTVGRDTLNISAIWLAVSSPSS